jgi:hypothetical protein
MNIFKPWITLGRLLSVFLFLTASGGAAATLETIQTGDNALIEMPGPQNIGAKVRIAIKLKPFEKFLVQGKNQRQRVSFRSVDTIRHMLRARIEQTNHFYIGDWHVETVPVKWSRAELTLEMNVRFYKRYGDSRELEEYVGHLPMVGQLVPGKQDGLYLFRGRARKQFQNKHGQPIIAVELGTYGPGQGGTVARKNQSQPQKTN